MSELKTTRALLVEIDFAKAVESIKEKLEYRQEQKGVHTYASIHECLGILQEEMTEFEAEVHGKTSRKLQIEELKDIAVAAIWSIASIESNKIDW